MTKLVGGVSGLLLVLALALPASAQVGFGGGLIYATDFDPLDLGVQAGVYVGMDQFVPGLRLGADVEFYFPQSETEDGTEVDVNFFAINGNAQFFFLQGGPLEAYALGGVSFGRASVSNGASESETELDFNLGGGIELPMTFGRIYVEGKAVVGEFDRAVFGVGVRFGI
jgi:hypothetical protein